MLARLYAMAGIVPKVIWSAEKVLEMLAFSVKGLTTSPAEPLVVEKWGLVVNQLIECWVLLWTSYAMMKEDEKAESARKYALLSFTILVGHDGRFNEGYGRVGKMQIDRGLLGCPAKFAVQDTKLGR